MQYPYVKIEKNSNPCLSDDGILINFFVGVVLKNKDFLFSYATTLDDAFKQVETFLNRGQ